MSVENDIKCKVVGVSFIMVSFLFIFILVIFNFSTAGKTLYDQKYEHDIQFNNECIVIECSDTVNLANCIGTIQSCQVQKVTEWLQQHEVTKYSTKLNDIWVWNSIYTLKGLDESSSSKTISIISLVFFLLGFLFYICDHMCGSSPNAVHRYETSRRRPVSV